MLSQSEQPMGRSIWTYGNPDKSELGFPMPGDLTQYLKGDIFAKEKGCYRYTQGKNADVIVLSRDGLHQNPRPQEAPSRMDPT